MISTFGASYWKSGLSRIRSVSEAVRLLSLVGSCLLLLLLLDSCRGPAAASLALTVGQLWTGELNCCYLFYENGFTYIVKKRNFTAESFLTPKYVGLDPGPQMKPTDLRCGAKEMQHYKYSVCPLLEIYYLTSKLPTHVYCVVPFVGKAAHQPILVICITCKQKTVLKTHCHEISYPKFRLVKTNPAGPLIEVLTIFECEFYPTLIFWIFWILVWGISKNTERVQVG